MAAQNNSGCPRLSGLLYHIIEKCDVVCQRDVKMCMVSYKTIVCIFYSIGILCPIKITTIPHEGKELTWRNEAREAHTGLTWRNHQVT
jgi:hypothetical protein